MSYTLISFIGTGMYKDDGYEKAKYIFPDKKEIETSIFIKALLKTKYRDFSKIVLLGTTTSGWDMFLEDDIDFWSEIKEKRENNLLSDEDFYRIQIYIQNKLEVPVVIKYHIEKIDSDTSLDIFNTYSSIIPEITDENILFDITHGFRSMPILLYQALQFAINQNQKIKNVELVYGELRGKGKPAYVRDLSNYWRYSQISDALNVFKTKLDGYKLAELIENDWLEGSKVIKRLSDIVQTNFSLQIIEVSKQINNSLKKYPTNAPNWLEDVKLFLEEILNCVTSNFMYTSLKNYAEFLFERKLNVQAIITLQVAVETYIAEKNGCADKIGDYDWWQSSGRTLLNKIKKSDWKNIGNPLTNLEGFRNQIAHGGGTNKDGNFPQASNIPSIYKSGLRGTENLINL